MIRLLLGASIVASASCRPRDLEPPARDWRVVGFVSNEHHPAALLASGRELAVVEPNGRMRWKLTLRDEAESHSADAVADVILVTAGNRLRALASTDGHEVWHRAFTVPIKHLHRGTSRILVMRSDGTEMLDLATGATRYANATSTEIVYFDRGRFVCATRGGLLWTIDETTGKELWSRAYPPTIDVDTSSSNVTRIFFSPTTLVVRGDGMRVDHRDTQLFRAEHELDLLTGQEVRTADIPVAPDPPVLMIGTTDDGHDYDVTEQQGRYSIVGRDAAGRTLWSVPAYKPNTGAAVLDSSGRVVVDLVGEERHLFFIDAQTGVSAVSPRLHTLEHFADVSGACALVFDTTYASCIDIVTGAQRWTTPLSGDSIAMWAVGDHDALLADGEPLALSRVDPDGRRRWRTVVGGDGPTSHYRDLVDPDNDFLVASSTRDDKTTRWQSAAMAVTTTQGKVRVIDLATGAVVTPRL